jgi:uncharacterized membrane protein
VVRHDGAVPAVSPVIPTRDDAFVGEQAASVGGRLGRRARVGTTWWTPLRVCFLICLAVFSTGVVMRAPCAATGFTDDDQYVKQCYSDVGFLFTNRDLDTDTFPYSAREEVERVVEYPVLQGLLMWAPALLVPNDLGEPQAVQRYYAITAMLLFLLLLVTVWATVRTARERPWDAVMVAAAPSIALVGTLNWDLLPVALLALAILAWSRERVWLAGILLGLGGAAKLYPLLMLLPLFILCVRAGVFSKFVRVLLGAIGAWLVVNVPVILAEPEGWRRFYDLSRERNFDFGSLWLGLRFLGFDAGSSSPSTVPSLVFLVLCWGIVALGWMAHRRPRFAQLALLTLAAFLLTNKVYSPQFALWMLPLVALARPRWRDFLIWQAGQTVYFLGVWLWLNGFSEPERAISDEGYAFLILIQVASTLWICAVVVRDILQPSCDPIRTRPDGTSTGVDDPTGGPVEGRPDGPAFPLFVRRREVTHAETVSVGSTTEDGERRE